MFNITNIDEIDFEEFKKYYQYLHYIKCNIGKFIQTDKTYVNFMIEQQKIFPDVKINQSDTYYHNLITDIDKRFKKYKIKVQQILQKLNLIIDTQITYQKLCNYDKELNNLKIKIEEFKHSVKNEDIEFVNRNQKRCLFLKETIIGNISNISIPITFSNEQKKEYLEKHYLKYRLVNNLKSLLKMNVNDILVLFKRKKFFNYLNKNFNNNEEYFSKKNKLVSILDTCSKINGFLKNYRYKYYLCPICPYTFDNEMNSYMHLYSNHKEKLGNFNFNKIWKLPNGYNNIVNKKCMFCSKIFTTEMNFEIINHIKIFHLFENVDNKDNIFKLLENNIKYNFKKKQEQTIPLFIKNNNNTQKSKSVLNLQKKKVDNLKYMFIDKLKHDYPNLFKIPNPYLDEFDMKNELRELLKEDDSLHYIHDGILKYTEEELYKKLFKVIKKLLGKSSFKKAEIQKNFGYKYGLMTIENEILSLLSFVKNDVFELLSNLIYGDSLSKYSIIIGELKSCFTNITRFSKRCNLPIHKIQKIINDSSGEELKLQEKNIHKCYEIFKTDSELMQQMLNFLLNFMNKISKISTSHKKQNQKLIQNIITPYMELNKKIYNTNFDENLEEIETIGFFMLLSYMDKPEYNYIVDDIFTNIVGNEKQNLRIEKPYAWTWEYSVHGDADETEQFFKDLKIVPENIKEYKDELVNSFSIYESDFKNPDIYTTDFNYLIDTLTQINIKSNENIYTKIQNIFDFFYKINTNKIIKGIEYETIYTFSNTRLKYFDEDELKLIKIKDNDIDNNSTKLLKMRKMILYQNINLIIVLSIIKNILTTSNFDNDDKDEKYRNISLAIFFKRYLQILSIEINKHCANNPLPIIIIPNKYNSSFLENENKQENDSQSQSSSDNENDSDGYPNYDAFQDIVDNPDGENNDNDYQDNEDNEDNEDNQDNQDNQDNFC